MRPIFFWPIFVSISVGTACAQVSPDTTVVGTVKIMPAMVLPTASLPGIVVRDSLRATSLKSTVSSRIVTPDRMTEWTGSTVADLLSAESMAFISKSGSTGSAGISLRGAGTDHTVVTLDGIELTDPQTGRLDISTIPVSFLRSVKVTLGSASRTGARSALGGTVELTSLEPTWLPSYRFNLQAGAYGKRRLGGSVSSGLGPVRTLLAIDLSTDTGDYPFPDPSSLQPRVLYRTGAEKQTQNFYARAITDVAGGRWDGSAWWSTTLRGVPGPANAEPTEATQKDDVLRLRLGSSFRLSGGVLTTSFALSDNNLVYSEGSTDGPGRLNRLHSTTMTFSGAASKALGPRWIAGIQADIQHVTATQGQSQNVLPGQDKFSLDTRFDFETTEMSTTAAVSIVRWQSPGEYQIHLLPRLAIRVSPGASDHFGIRASVGRVFRTPSFNDRYWVPGGNPELVAESGWTIDSGVTYESGAGTPTLILNGGLFASSLSDKIVWQPGLAGSGIRVWTPRNVGRVVGYGADSSADLIWRVSPMNTMKATLLATWTRIEDRTREQTRSYGRQLRYTPEYTFKALLRVNHGDFHIELIHEWVSQRYTSSDEKLPLDPYGLLTIRGGHVLKTPVGFVLLSVAVENVSNAAIEHIRFYPMPPRHLTFSLKYQLSDS